MIGQICCVYLRDPTFWPNIFLEFLGRIFFTNRIVILHMTEIYDQPEMNRPDLAHFFQEKFVQYNCDFEDTQDGCNRIRSWQMYLISTEETMFIDYFF